jgi:WD40 repeat protein
MAIGTGAPLWADDPPKDKPAAGEVRRFAHGSYIYQVFFSPDGKLVVTDDQVWETATGKKVATLPLPPVDRRPSSNLWMAFSTDSRFVAVHRFFDLVFAEAATGKEVWRVELEKQHQGCRPHGPRLAFTPDGKYLLSARNDEARVRVWTVAKGEAVRSFPYDPKTGVSVNSMGVSRDGRRVVVHSKGIGLGGPAVFDFETGKELHRSTVDGWAHYSAPTDDGNQFVYTEKNHVYLLDLQTGKEVRRFEGVGEYAIVVAVAPDGKHIAASVRAKDSENDGIQVWDTSNGKSLRVFQGHLRHVTSLAFSPDGTHILSGGEDKTGRLWRLKD